MINVSRPSPLVRRRCTMCKIVKDIVARRAKTTEELQFFTHHTRLCAVLTCSLVNSKMGYSID